MPRPRLEQPLIGYLLHLSSLYATHREEVDFLQFLLDAGYNTSQYSASSMCGEALPKQCKKAHQARMNEQLSMMEPRQKHLENEAEADISIWKEALFGAELLLLYASPVYYGLGIPKGDGSAVVVIPGFLGTDVYLTHLNSWLNRIGYRSYMSGIGLNAECPNLLIRYKLNETIAGALKITGRRIHLIGHSLGGVIARSVAAQRPDEIASVITLGSPFRGTVVHHSILRAAKAVRKRILREHGDNVLPQCYTARCTCEFLQSLRCEMPKSVLETALFTKDDGVVDWRYCRTGKRRTDFEVPGTHIGMAFNPSVYNIVADRLAKACD